jgi:hypothetical protein
MPCGVLRPDEMITQEPFVVTEGCTELRRQLMPGLKKFANSCTSIKELSVEDTITSREDGFLDTINTRDAVADETTRLGMIARITKIIF